MPKPPTELTIPKADEVRKGSCPQYEALLTPVTPVSAEALTSLLNMIKQAPDDETSRQHKERLQQKVTTAAQMFLAKNSFLKNRNQFLVNINNEGKVRRLTKSEILGKARVMSYEDLEKARAERTIKEAAKEVKKGAKKVKKIVTAGNGKRDRKRKSPEEADVPEPKAKVARMNEAQVEEDGIAPELWRPSVV